MITKANTFGLPILYLVIVAIVYGFNMPMPQDDLLRDIVASAYNYDYNQMYIYAPFLAKYNQYILFDHILHAISSIIGNTATAHAVQIFCYLNFIIPCVLILRRIMRHDRNCYLYLTLLLLVLLNDFSMLRLTLARPEMIFTCWIVWGVWFKLIKNTLGKTIWLISGFLMIPSYWLAFFYIPAIYIVFERRIYKVGLSLLFMFVTVIFWQWYSHNQWLVSVLDLGHLNSNRIATIGENKPIIKMLFTPITSVALVIYLYTYRIAALDFVGAYKRSPKDALMLVSSWIRSISWTSFETSLILLLLCYLSINMIRYAAIISALFCILLAIRLTKQQLLMPSIMRYITLVLAIFMPMTVGCYTTIPKFKIPTGSYVLGMNMANYYVPFYNPGVKVAPAMELGANLKDIQALMKSIDIDNTISCTELKKYHINYLIEKKLTQIPPCLQIYQIQQGWRAWKVIYD